MARFETNGLAELSISFEKMGQLDASGTLDRMLIAEADVIAKAQKEVGMQYGVHRTGTTLESISVGKPGGSGGAKHIYVRPRGLNADGNRNAEVAFINEFGKKGQAPRPFIRDANESHMDEAVDAAEEIYDKWLSSLGL
jgi:HK97 gp10 family phage protein